MTEDTNNTWHADHLRISLFSDDNWRTSAEDIFLTIFGSAPETIINKTIASEYSAIGNWDEFKVETKTAFNRIDFIIQAMPSSTEPLPLIEDVQNTLPKFTTLIASWIFSQSQNVNRIAIGCNGFLPSTNLDDSYVKMKNLIQVINIDTNRFRDFNFQVNLPKTSSISPDISINRLSRWAPIALRATFLGINTNQLGDEMHYVSCSLDVNTDGERTNPIAKDLVEKLIEELSKICIDTLTIGIS